MSGPRRPVLLWVVAAAAFAGCVLSWIGSRSSAAVAPILNGEPQTTSVIYSPPMLTLALLLAAVGGVCAVLAVSRRRR